MTSYKGTLVAAVLAVASLCAAPNASAEVRLTIQNGRVSLVAKDATVRQILAEWARLGQTKIVNLDRIPGGPLTLELDNVSEEHALDVLLRTVSGYIAAPRPAQVANLSRFDRIFVMPTAAPPRAAAVVAAPAPTFPQQMPPPADDDTDDDRPAPPVPVPNPRGPIFNTFPQPQPAPPGGAMPPGFANPQQTAPQPQEPGANPTVPTGVAVPGMVVPAPQQPGMPGQPQPGQPRRPGGEPDRF
jgi:hypothetical protein